ncbi:M23 family metallopeptidase [Cryobacterium psychrophilum]|uniref:M23 family metallopeptidase n=1 Tax=Cryobacterium psychrophilum TaxID=41988 RepID=A0A4Y8KT35_9MICO|nr:M23 family metallopeptidase [Cryobacterium psychrophilum]TDW31239.1 peptidase M23-like protein [Cryobacterium psychrophilum]TFD78470.1 M23 family metallopeptidase [Cryobacterium psychrophilum]
MFTRKGPARSFRIALLAPLVLVVFASATAAATPWSWPLAPPHTIEAGFIAPLTPYVAGHRGIDVPAERGAAVFAPSAGVVSFAGVVADRPVVSIAHAGDLISSVEPVDAVVTVGDRVAAGQQVGTLAAGGHCARRCLHFGVREHGLYVSPLRFLGGLPRAVLLPNQARGWASR